MMKNMNLVKLVCAFGLPLLAAGGLGATPLAVGTVTEDRNYATFDGSGNTTTGTTIQTAGVGSVVVLYYYTPW